MSGCDIKNHDDDPLKATKAVRDWLVTEALNTGPSANRIWSDFNDFNAYLYSKAVEEDGHSTVDELPIPEVIHHIGSWLENRENT